MIKEMITIHDLETGEISQREMTAEELAQRKADLDATVLFLEQEAEAQAEAKAAKAAAQAKLAALGLTTDDLKALGL